MVFHVPAELALGFPLGAQVREEFRAIALETGGEFVGDGVVDVELRNPARGVGAKLMDEGGAFDQVARDALGELVRPLLEFLTAALEGGERGGSR